MTTTASNRRLAIQEVVWVLLVSLGASGIWALLRVINLLTQHRSLSSQVATIVSSVTPDRPWLDLAYQLVGIGLALAPVGLVGYLLVRSGDGLGSIGLDRTRVWSDLGRGLLLASLVGGTGLALYIAARHLGWNVTLVPTSLGPVWWAIPVLLLAAFENAILEETIVLGYLLLRLEQIGMRAAPAVVLSALIRGSYHLYQGFGGFLGNVAMGLLFGWCWLKWRRVMPMLLAHGVIDAVAFVGYQLLRGRVSWLP